MSLNRMVLFAGVCFFNLSNSFAQDIIFEKHLEINERVEAFANTVSSSLMTSFVETELRFARDKEGQVLDDFVNGRIDFTLTGRAGEGDGTSELDMSFDMDIANATTSSIEYAINMQVDGSISQPQNYLMQLKQSEGCQNNSKIMCQIAQNIVPGDNFLTSTQTSMEDWKTEFLKSASEYEAQSGASRIQFDEIREDFISYLDQRIQVVTEEGGVRITASMSDLRDLFSDDDPEQRHWINEVELRDYILQDLNIFITNESIDFGIHFVKLHVHRKFDIMVELSAGLQENFEDLDFAALVASSLKTNPLELQGSIKSNLGYGEQFSLGSTKTLLDFTGSSNTGVTPTAEDEDLGLD